MLNSKPHPEMGYRPCIGILRLTKKCSAQRVEAASARALLLEVSPTAPPAACRSVQGAGSRPDPPVTAVLRGCSGAAGRSEGARGVLKRPWGRRLACAKC